jgi:hypothetical protein
MVCERSIANLYEHPPGFLAELDRGSPEHQEPEHDRQIEHPICGEDARSLVKRGSKGHNAHHRKPSHFSTTGPREQMAGK